MRRLLAAPVLLLRGRRAVEPGETPLPYASALGLLTAVLLGGALVAVVVVAVVVPWPWLRTALLVIGAAAALSVLASWCAAVVYPHVVGAEQLRLRQGAFGWQDVPLDAIARVSRTPRVWRRSGLVSDGEDVGYVLNGRTEIEVALGQAVPLRLRGRTLHPATVHLAVDEPAAAMQAFGAALRGRTEP